MYRQWMHIFWLLVLFISCTSSAPEPVLDQSPDLEEFIGRWDVTVQGLDTSYPSWFEISKSGEDLVGQFVGRVGSARPIQHLSIVEGQLTFSLPVQYEEHKEGIWFKGTAGGIGLSGTTNAEDGTTLSWTAVRAPTLGVTTEPEWDETIDLLEGGELTAWRLRDESVPNTWKVEDGVLRNTETGTDLITQADFGDFQLHIEFNCPEGSNSGIYLRGRYEVQVMDGYGQEPASRGIGGVYGFLTPSVNTSKPSGEWQTYDITLVGRTLTLALNGETVINGQEIPGITGGALDSAEGEPGPLMLQGDHGPISYRNIKVTPAKR